MITIKKLTMAATSLVGLVAISHRRADWPFYKATTRRAQDPATRRQHRRQDRRRSRMVRAKVDEQGEVRCGTWCNGNDRSRA